MKAELKEKIQAFYASQGIVLLPEDYDYIASQWSFLLSLKEALDEQFLNDFDIALRWIPYREGSR